MPLFTEIYFPFKMQTQIFEDSIFIKANHEKNTQH